MSADTDSRIDGVLATLADMLPNGAPLHQPVISGNEWMYVKECLDTAWVSSIGSYVNRFESMIHECTGVGHVAATVNGTAALHACLVLAGVKPGDEVVVPTLTFVATANAVEYCHATPHFADACPRTLGIDVGKLDVHLRDLAETKGGLCFNKQTGRVIRAVVCVHTFGHPADLDALLEVCERHHLILIEDAAESLGSLYKGTHTGNHGRLAALSFNGNKIVTTGGGGAVMTNDPNLGTKAKHLTTTAKVEHRWNYEHDMVGYNYCLPNINAAIGCAQLERLDEFVERKRNLADAYKHAFCNVEGGQFFEEPTESRSNYWLNVLVLETDLANRRDTLFERGNDAGIMIRPAWEPMHTLVPFRQCPCMDLSVAEDLCRRVINIPSGAGIETIIDRTGNTT